MFRTFPSSACVAVLVLLGAGLASGQQTFEYTLIVDQSGNWDHMTIQAAINDNRIGNNPQDRWTILIYAGEYTIDSVDDLIELGGFKENVDLVGIDREAVIIDVTIGDAQNPRPGIKITSGAETSRNNSIRNLTIKTTHGHGIEIVKGGTPAPKDIIIENVTIEAAGSNMKGIEATAADSVRIFNCKVESDAGDGVDVGDNFEIISSVLTTRSTVVQRALRSSSKDGLLVSNCTLQSTGVGFDITGSPPSKNIQVVSSEIRGAKYGLHAMPPGANVRLRDCLIVADGDSPTGHIYAIYMDWAHSTSDVVFQGCRIEAIGGANSSNVRGYQVDNTQNVRLIDCHVRAVCQNSGAEAVVYGVCCPLANVMVIGGSIETSQPNFYKAIDVFDLVGDNTGEPSAEHIFVSRARFSKWIGPINSAERPRSVAQRMLNVEEADPVKIVDSAELDGETIEFDPPVELDNYRALKATWNNPPMAGNITITVAGTNWAGHHIAEAFELSTVTPQKEGLKPFKTVEKIFIPEAEGTLSVGTTDKLGLYYPISASSDVLQEARLVNGVYTIQNTGTVDEVYATVIPSALNDGDSFEWVVLASQ